MATKPTRQIMGRPPHLTEQQVAELRQWYQARKSLGNLKQKAAEFNVDTSTVMKAIRVGYKQFGLK